MKSVAVSLVALLPFVYAQSGLYQQCGGIGWSGATTCVSGSVCTELNDYYSQCLPGTATTSSSSPAPSSPASSIPFMGGVNTAGYDFSVATNGSFSGTGVSPPVDQFTHFASQGANIFRIPFAWQLMTPTVGGSINETFFQIYDTTVQAALSSGSNVHAILDVHNYARWNGEIIAQGGPTNDQFASLWSQIAEKYASESRVIFGVMNEPHDIPDLKAWAGSVQAAVNAIRAAGATSQLILIPGSSYSSAQALPTEAGPDLLTVTDPAGGTSKLLFDVHKYLDSDNSGTHPDCTTDNVQVLQTLVSWLKSNGNRQAILSETGGGNTASCETLLNNQLAFVKSNSDSLVGFTTWAAGAFDTTYVLTETPFKNGTDQALWTAAIRPNLP
ncbi:endoglucanase [Fomitiporia mediterranea MF3/22]|uniref:endoglucanase n=1 Tax=Fomitiporia mediterranea (strain MF3/22) TaxID=694068 RepID=UPI0004408852|nr:endoglucanase [Fomitiporia mediterranea MF3/22]EJD03695.1 endoglucanase [Fomitiporia mediterranea MF3/22]